ncbi:centrosomal protein of 131 kDa [Talpa occidentalis]|uniref:centrosomal protein of 131 kDa n=1 Tax=Talpa occidentalis TaxID=50954 RepID=UPI0023FA2C8E|nr:centrosomal protein of 131 kDa [Talpa occidentalis]XP_054545208.1 centrosomal protein of 131 kDa [Talpa occidentalis]
MKASRAVSSPAGPPRASPEGVDLSLTGLPPPVSQRPNSASATRPLARTVSVVVGSEPRRRALGGPGLGGPLAANNLRRSSSATQVSQQPAGPAWTGSCRPAERPDFLMLFEDSPGGRQRLASPDRASSDQGATGNVPGEPPGAPRPRTPAAPACPRKRECPVTLAPSFTANNRSSKGAVGNRVTAMVRNQHSPAEEAPPPKSSNHAPPSLNNIVKAATGEARGGSSCQKPPKNLASPAQVAWSSAGPPGRRTEVTEEEAERFIHQVNRAAVTIQRWFRRQQARRRAGAACLDHLLASEQEGQRRWPGEASPLDLQQRTAAARRIAREEQARQARQAAIQELQQKRARKAGGLEPEPPPKPGGTAHYTLKANNAGAQLCPLGQRDRRRPAPGASAEPQQRLENEPQGVAGEGPEVVDPTGGRAKSRATLDELLDTLKLLEEEPEPLPRPRAYQKDKYAWTDEGDDGSSLTADNLEKLGKLSAPTGPPEGGTLLSEAKLQSIVSFLHEMEEAGQDWPASAPQGPEEGPGRLEQVSEAGASVMRLQLEVEEKKQAAALLQRALAQQRDLAVRRVKETERELGRQLRQQREHYEAAVQRHLSFIDQLIEDKKALSGKCEALVAELTQGDQRHKQKVAQMQEQHELEIQKLKELMSATEKVRREKWIHEKTRKIKEITVRGLEPEIQRLIAKHRQEVKRLQGLHAAELLRADERAAQDCARQLGELRELLEREKAALGQQERERAQQRFEQHLEQEQRALQQQRRRLYSEVAEEKERLGQQAARQRAELEELRQQLEESSAAGGRALRAEFEKEREGQERRHQMELQALKDQLEAERQAWEASCARKEEARLLARERELKEETRIARDREIELVVHRLEADVTLAREESERAAESRVKRIRDKYEAELAELERSERQLQERCAQLRGRLGEAEGEAGRLQGLLRQRERELAEASAVSEKLTAERSSLAQVLRQEFADRLAASEEATRQARAELAELQARQRVELEQLTREKQAELEAVHGRVKLALAKKEEAVSSLRRQHEAAVKRADHLEELLEQRRRALPSAK